MEPASVCNALCSYCPTGYRNRLHKVTQKRYITAHEYGEKLDDLISRGIVKKDVFVDLYNWGEPFLTPEIAGIIEVLNTRNLRYAISTNASVPRLFSSYGENFLKNLDSLIFSMPGLSQESYDRIHSFDAEKIKENIEKILTNYGAAGFVGHVRIAMHQYRFNVKEWQKVSVFAQSHGMELSPFCASLVNYDEYIGYMQGSLLPDRMRQIREEVFIDELQKTVTLRPEGYRCPQLDICTVDCFGQEITLCCAVDCSAMQCEGQHIAQGSLEEIYDSKYHSTICTKCSAVGFDYLCHHLPVIPLDSYSKVDDI